MTTRVNHDANQIGYAVIRHSNWALIYLVCTCSLLACQGERYSVTLPIVRPHDQQDWSVVDSLIRYNRPCDKHSYGRRIIWLSFWERQDSNIFQISLTKDRAVPYDVLGCTFREGEMVVIVGTESKDLFRMTESTVDVYLDNYDEYPPEDFSFWKLLLVRDRFEILESYPLHCR